MTDRYSLYRLIDPRDGRARYIGCSRQFRQRIKTHTSPAGHDEQRPCAVVAWKLRLLARGLCPVVEVLGIVHGRKQALYRERREIELHAIEHGYSLLNRWGNPLWRWTGKTHLPKGRLEAAAALEKVAPADRRRRPRARLAALAAITAPTESTQ
jgi:hypothetical protein